MSSFTAIRAKISSSLPSPPPAPPVEGRRDHGRRALLVISGSGSGCRHAIVFKLRISGLSQLQVVEEEGRRRKREEKGKGKEREARRKTTRRSMQRSRAFLYLTSQV
mmetsp:Transcript_48505/g.152107  ORF Transcript_48505/g.152107 Transcript_48505/m.152107 type:complete len:107 (+) Transcript_48505:1306-1626(+)